MSPWIALIASSNPMAEFGDKPDAIVLKHSTGTPGRWPRAFESTLGLSWLCIDSIISDWLLSIPWTCTIFSLKSAFLHVRSATLASSFRMNATESFQHQWRPYALYIEVHIPQMPLVITIKMPFATRLFWCQKGHWPTRDSWTASLPDLATLAWLFVFVVVDSL